MLEIAGIKIPEKYVERVEKIVKEYTSNFGTQYRLILKKPWAVGYAQSAEWVLYSKKDVLGMIKAAGKIHEFLWNERNGCVSCE